MMQDRGCIKGYVDKINEIAELMDSSSAVGIEKKLAIDDVNIYVENLIENWGKLKGYRNLSKSLFEIIGRNELNGYIGSYVVDYSLESCLYCARIEKEINEIIDKIITIKPDRDRTDLEDIKERVSVWHRKISANNIEYVKMFLNSLLDKVKEINKSLFEREEALSREKSELEKQLDEANSQGQNQPPKILSFEELVQKAANQGDNGLSNRIV